jgi:hypothetical protein
VAGDAVVPAENAFDEAEHAARIAPVNKTANQAAITTKNAAMSRKNSTM